MFCVDKILTFFSCFAWRVLCGWPLRKPERPREREQREKENLTLFSCTKTCIVLLDQRSFAELPCPQNLGTLLQSCAPPLVSTILCKFLSRMLKKKETHINSCQRWQEQFGETTEQKELHMDVSFLQQIWKTICDKSTRAIGTIKIRKHSILPTTKKQKTQTKSKFEIVMKTEGKQKYILSLWE